MLIQTPPEDRPINLIDPTYNQIEKKPPQKPRRFLLIALILVIIILGGNYVYQKTLSEDSSQNQENNDSLTLKPKKLGIIQAVKNFIFNSEDLMIGQQEDRINILLLGMGGYGHDGPFLTDTNIILSIKPNTKEVAMISIPRDLGVKIGDFGLQKINHANSFGEVKNAGQGGEYARTLFAEIFNLDIPYYIRVDFKAFADLVNAVGGVEINVPNSFTDTAYPGPNDSYQTIVFETGLQTMDGETALKYARSRHGNNGEGSDFARAKRQQLIIMALKDKMLSFGTYTNPVKMQKIYDSLSAHVSTNLDFGQIMYLAGLGRDVQNNIKNMVLDNSENGYLQTYNTQETGFLLIPKTGNFENINLAIKNVFDEVPPTTVSQTTSVVAVATATEIKTESTSFFPQAKIEIQNGTWRAGLAGRVQKNLESRGFTVSSIGNSYKRPITETAVYLINADLSEEVQANIKQELKIIPSTQIPEWLRDDYDDPETTLNEMGVKYKPDTDLLIILGENYAE